MYADFMKCICYPFYLIAILLVKRCSLAAVVILFVSLTTTLIALTYYLDVWYQGTSPAWLPMISDTGNYPPASMVFSLAAGFASLLVGIIALAVYQYYEVCISIQRDKERSTVPLSSGTSEEECYNERGPECYLKIEKRADRRSVYNAMLLFSAGTSVIGLCTLAAFQLNHAYELHAVGFVALCGNAYIYFGSLTHFSRRWLTGIMDERKFHLVDENCSDYCWSVLSRWILWSSLYLNRSL
eukprot:sb/3469062/